jgi:hypothetical protein
MAKPRRGAWGHQSDDDDPPSCSSSAHIAIPQIFSKEEARWLLTSPTPARRKRPRNAWTITLGEDRSGGSPTLKTVHCFGHRTTQIRAAVSRPGLTERQRDVASQACCGQAGSFDRLHRKQYALLPIYLLKFKFEFTRYEEAGCLVGVAAINTREVSFSRVDSATAR